MKTKNGISCFVMFFFSIVFLLGYQTEALGKKTYTVRNNVSQLLEDSLKRLAEKPIKLTIEESAQLKRAVQLVKKVRPLEKQSKSLAGRRAGTVVVPDINYCSPGLSSDGQVLRPGGFEGKFCYEDFEDFLPPGSLPTVARVKTFWKPYWNSPAMFVGERVVETRAESRSFLTEAGTVRSDTRIFSINVLDDDIVPILHFLVNSDGDIWFSAGQVCYEVTIDPYNEIEEGEGEDNNIVRFTWFYLDNVTTDDVVEGRMGFRPYSADYDEVEILSCPPIPGT